MSVDRRPEYGVTDPHQNYGGMQRRDMQVQIGGETVRLSPSDMMLVKQCGRECFVGRILPMTLASCGSIYVLAKSGRIQSSYLKYVGAFIGSFFVGKLSFASRCEDIIANSNTNTPFVEAIRRKRASGDLRSSKITIGGQEPSESWTYTDNNTRDRWSTTGVNARSQKNKWGDSGFEREDQSGFTNEAGFDESTNVNDPFDEKNSNWKATEDETMAANQPKYTSYDELRQKNRSSFKY